MSYPIDDIPVLNRSDKGTPVTYLDAPTDHKWYAAPSRLWHGTYPPEVRISIGHSPSATEATIEGIKLTIAAFVRCQSERGRVRQNMKSLAFSIGRAIGKDGNPATKASFRNLIVERTSTPWILAAEDAGQPIRGHKWTRPRCLWT